MQDENNHHSPLNTFVLNNKIIDKSMQTYRKVMHGKIKKSKSEQEITNFTFSNVP